ncbi:MAG TPA: PH domain-containing protein, partial [Halobacteriales archaeon]|nr:PH domain-containing protein [Halobacteriales archaeon]
GRPSPYLVKHWIGVAALVLLAGIVALVWVLPPNWGWIGWLAVVGGLVVAAYACVAYRTVYYVITTAKVYKKTGLLSTEVQTVRLDRIQNASFSQSLLQRPIE